MEPLFLKKKTNENDIVINKTLLRGHSLMNKIKLKQFNHLYNECIYSNKRKNSFDFTQKYSIKDPEEGKGTFKRKYTIENYLSIKGFVPTLKPIERRISPSKLLLNKKDKTHFHFHKNNLNGNPNYISCPNSEEEVDSEFNSSQNMLFYHPKINNNENSNENLIDILRKPSIKDARKNLHRTKNKNNQKSYSRQNSLIKEKLENKFNIDLSIGSDLYDDEYNGSLQLRIESNDKDNTKCRNRINSFSILTMLQKKFKLEE